MTGFLAFLLQELLEEIQEDWLIDSFYAFLKYIYPGLKGVYYYFKIDQLYMQFCF